MAELYNIAPKEFSNSSQSRSGSESGVPGYGPQEPVATCRGPTVRVKNLDTGEEFDIEEIDSRPSVLSRARRGSSEADPPGAINEDQELPSRGAGAKKAWLKRTKKLKSWAKTTLTNVKEKIEERIEKRQSQQQQQLQQQQLQQQQIIQQPPLAPLQQQNLQRKQREASTRSGSFEEWGRDSHPDKPHSEGEPRSATLPALPTLQHGARETGTDAAAGILLDSTVTGDLEGVVDDESMSGRGGSFSGSVASASTASTATPKMPCAGSELRCDDSSGAGVKLGSGGGGKAAVTTASVPAAGSAATAATPPALDASPGMAVASKAAGVLAKTQVPRSSSLRNLATHPLGAGAAGSSSSAATAVAPVTGLSVTSLVQETAPQQQHSSEELRQPLLEEDVAGPSSRAVPSSKSCLNLPARVVGGRRSAGRQLQQVRMIQELLGHDGPVWVVKFSADARLLATAGRDGVLRVWSVYWYETGRSKLIVPSREVASTPSASALNTTQGLPPTTTASTSSGEPRLQLLSESPLLHLPGHRGDVLDLSWSQCRLLLTASADQTARLWCIDVHLGSGGEVGGGNVVGEVGRRTSGSGTEGDAGEGHRARAGGRGGPAPSGECLRSFVHPDFVMSCCFHPSDPRRIVTGCADGKIRVWSVPDAAVVATATVQQDIITRVLFAASGTRVVAGTLRGKAYYYDFIASGGGAGAGAGDSAGLEYVTQLDVKNKHSSGQKVTGLAQVPYTYGNDQLYVITSADSRIRLYVGYTQERKFKGHRHTNTQIAASLSPSCQHLMCGSDDGWVYVWETGLPPPPPPGPISGPSLSGAATSGIAAVSGGKEAPAAFGPARARSTSKAAAVTTVALRGGGKIKEGMYEAFHTPEPTTTVAIIAPNVCRLGRGLERPLGAAAATGVTASLAGASLQPPLLGALFVVAGFTGKIYVYENLPAQASKDV